ncbi:hypothetical protein DVH24_002746 [Malus domestica]|uniref:Rho-GAP domain-containing protein n=1 Tax=Malus domestica TaxID=3750 RepID=A0A498K5G6_MALDO|nr:hypothetical protein DVH24_002746 [Malus domestica]
MGLPVEFEVEIPGRVPSASASVFGVSAESMQLSFDSKWNSVSTILLLMQERYSQEGLKSLRKFQAEGIFRINPKNSHEELVRSQLYRGIVPDDIDCNTEEESVELVKQLKPTEAAPLNWAINLMADVVEEEELNKMNARNIVMVIWNSRKDVLFSSIAQRLRLIETKEFYKTKELQKRKNKPRGKDIHLELEEN